MSEDKKVVAWRWRFEGGAWQLTQDAEYAKWMQARSAYTVRRLIEHEDDSSALFMMEKGT